MKRARDLVSGVALLTAALTGASCSAPEDVPPAFSVFSVTDKFFDVDSLGDDTFLALGYGSKILKSQDAGLTWEKYSQPEGRSLTQLTFRDANNGFGVGHTGAIQKTTDGGKTWSAKDSKTKVALFDLAYTTDQKMFVIGDESIITQSSDGGETWSAETLPISEIGVRPDMSLAIEDPIFYDIEFLDENRGWIVGEYGQIRVTDDGGQTWGAQHDDLLGGRIRDVMALPTFFSIKFADDLNGLAVGTYGSIIATNDGGETWKYLESPVKIPLYKLVPVDGGDFLIVASSGNILRGNATSGFQPVEAPPGVYSWISSAAFQPGGKGVAVGGFGLVLTSNDAGKSWERTFFQ